MKNGEPTKRREFLGGIAAGAITLGLGSIIPRSLRAEIPERETSPVKPTDKWITELTGTRRQFFDAPLHTNGWALFHVRNYFTTYESAYGKRHPDVTAVVSLYGMGTLMAFNDAMWKKWNVGKVLNVMDTSKSTAKWNVLARAETGSPSLNVSGAPVPIPADSSIASLQSKGAIFLLCNNALGVWSGLLASQSGQKPDAVRDELLANLLPGIHLVPAMVIAINQAQKNGCSYMFVA